MSASSGNGVLSEESPGADLPETEHPAVVVVAILTDGLENASKHYTARDISQRIKHQREAYDWRFVFLSAGQDAFETAAQLSIEAEDAVPFVASETGIHEAFAAMNTWVSNSREPEPEVKVIGALRKTPRNRRGVKGQTFV